MTQDPPPRELRIGDRERDVVVGMLQQAAADGRLSLAELDNRLAVAMRARTYSDLEPVIIDLAGGLLSLELSGAGPATRRPTLPGYSRDDPLRLDGAEKRLGVWRAPPFIRINHGSRWVRLDFERATIDSSVIDIEVIGGAGWILLVLPAGWAADLDRLATGWGSTSVKVPREPAAGKPLLVIHGSVGSSKVDLDRRPSNWEALCVMFYRARRDLEAAYVPPASAVTLDQLSVR